MCPGAVDRACKILRLWPDAMASKNAVLHVTLTRDALAIGSKGDLASASNTFGRLHEGSNFREGGLLRKKALNNLVRVGALEIIVPSGKPHWTTAIADLYALIVGRARPLSNKCMKKSTILCKGAEGGLIACSSHH